MQDDEGLREMVVEEWRARKERWLLRKEVVNVLLIYSGGTVGMEKTERGFKVRRDFLGELFR